jgi:hypothetical protein
MNLWKSRRNDGPISGYFLGAFGAGWLMFGCVEIEVPEPSDGAKFSANGGEPCQVIALCDRSSARSSAYVGGSFPATATTTPPQQKGT